MDESSWQGPDADQFRSTWSSGVSSSFQDVVERLRQRSRTLGDQADEQDQASDGDRGSSQGSGGGDGSGEGSPSLWDRLMSGKDIYNKMQTVFSKSKKAFDLLKDVYRGSHALDAIKDPITALMAAGMYGKSITSKVFSSTKEYGVLAQKIAGQLHLPTGFGNKNFFGWADDLAGKVPFLTKAAPFVGKALPGIDVLTGGYQMVSSIKSGDTFHAVTGGASALGGGLMLAGGAMSATGVGAVIGGPIAATGAVIAGGAAVADLGKLAWDHRQEIAEGLGNAKDWAVDTGKDIASGAADVASDVGDSIADGVSGAWHGVFG
ncbi:hypothetical protein [Brachybacterium endophyticum]